MRKKVHYLIILMLSISALIPYAYGADERIPVRTQTYLKVGEPAPDFTLPASMPVDGKEKVTLSQFKGKKNVVLSFHVLDWTPV
jgi:peroxiredoxin (alkyl hydroperoxide reductase subunit C)